MRRSLLLLTIFLSASAIAEQGVLVLNVNMIPPSVPRPAFEIGPAGDGVAGVVDQNGKARIHLAAQTKVGSIVRLKIQRPPGFAFINDETPVPSFENSSGYAVEVYIMERGSWAALMDAKVPLAAVAQSGAAKPATVKKSALSSPYVFAFAQVAAPSPSRNGLLGASAISLVSDNVLEKFGFTRDQMSRAFDTWKADALTWNVAVELAHFAGIADPFSRVQSDEIGIVFGLGQWDSLFGNLQDEMKEFRKADPTHFDAIMGDDLPAVLKWMTIPAPGSLAETRKLMQEANYSLKPVWAGRFKEIGNNVSFQHAQMDYMKLVCDRVVRQATILGLHSERAIGFIYHATWDLNLDNPNLWSGGPDERINFARVFGRAPDEQEMMQLLANMIRPAIAAQYEKAQGKRAVDLLRTNLHAYAIGEGYLPKGKKVTMRSIGLDMRDFRTGEMIQLVGDKKIQKRLESGLRPGDKKW